MGRYTWLMLDAGKTREPAQPVNMTFAAAALRRHHWASPGASREVGEGTGCAAPEDEPPADAVDEVELIWKKAVAARTLQLTAEQPATPAARAPASPKPDAIHSQPPSRSLNALPRNSALGRADSDYAAVTYSLPPALSFSPSAGDLASVLASRRRLQGTYPAVPPAGAMPPPGPLPDLSIPGQSTSGGSGGGGHGGVGGGGPPRHQPFTAPGVALDSDSEGEGGGGGGGGQEGGRLRPGRQRSRSFSQLPLVVGGGGGMRGAAAAASGDDTRSDDGELADDDCADEPGATEPGLMPADAAAAAATAVATFGLRDSTGVAGVRAVGATTAALVRALSTKNALAGGGPGGGGGGGGLVAALLSSSGAANGGGGAGGGGLGLAGFARGLFGGGAGAAGGGAGGGGGAEVPSSVSDGYDAGWSAGGGGGNEDEGEGGGEGEGEGEGRDGGCLVLPVLRTLLDMQQQSGQAAAALALSAARGKGGSAAKPNSHGGPSAATAISRQASQLLRASASTNRLMSAQSPNGLARQGSSSLATTPPGGGGGGGGGVASPGCRTGSGGAMPDGLRSSPSRTMLMSAMRPSPLALPRSGGAGAADDGGAPEVVGGGADDGLDVDTAAAAAAVPGSGGTAASSRVRLPPGRTKSYGPGMLPSPAAALPVGSPQGGGPRGSPIPRTSGGGSGGGGGGGGLHSPGGPRASTSTGLLPPAATASPRSLTAGVGMGLGLAGSSSPGASPLGSAAAAAAVGLGGAGGGGGLPSPSAAGVKGSPRGSRFSWANKLAGRGPFESPGYNGATSGGGAASPDPLSPAAAVAEAAATTLGGVGGGIIGGGGGAGMYATDAAFGRSASPAPGLATTFSVDSGAAAAAAAAAATRRRQMLTEAPPPPVSSHPPQPLPLRGPVALTVPPGRRTYTGVGASAGAAVMGAPPPVFGEPLGSGTGGLGGLGGLVGSSFKRAGPQQQRDVGVAQLLQPDIGSLLGGHGVG